MMFGFETKNINLLRSKEATVAAHSLCSILTMSMEFDKKTFQTEANTPLITKMALKNFLNIFG